MTKKKDSEHIKNQMDEQVTAREDEVENQYTQGDHDAKATSSDGGHEGESLENPGGEAGAGNGELTKLQELQEKYDTLNDKYLRLYSEFENYRRRTSKEKIEVLKSASDRLIRELLPVLDDFDRAIEANKDASDIQGVKEGFELIYNKFFGILKNEGLKPMDSLHKDFDTDLHDAITNIPAPKENLKGKVVDVAEKGYLMHDRVLRHAKVVVGQ